MSAADRLRAAISHDGSYRITTPSVEQLADDIRDTLSSRDELLEALEELLRADAKDVDTYTLAEMAGWNAIAKARGEVA